MADLAWRHRAERRMLARALCKAGSRDSFHCLNCFTAQTALTILWQWHGGGDVLHSCLCCDIFSRTTRLWFRWALGMTCTPSLSLPAGGHLAQQGSTCHAFCHAFAQNFPVCADWFCCSFLRAANCSRAICYPINNPGHTCISIHWLFIEFDNAAKRY